MLTRVHTKLYTAIKKLLHPCVRQPYFNICLRIYEYDVYTSVLMNVYSTTDLHICTQAPIDMSAHSHTYTVHMMLA